MTDPTNAQLDAMAKIADYYTQVIEVASGHRRRAIEAGFTNEVAEQMGLVAHNTLMDVLRQQAEPS